MARPPMRTIAGEHFEQILHVDLGAVFVGKPRQAIAARSQPKLILDLAGSDSSNHDRSRYCVSGALLSSRTARHRYSFPLDEVGAVPA